MFSLSLNEINGGCEKTIFKPFHWSGAVEWNGKADTKTMCRTGSTLPPWLTRFALNRGEINSDKLQLIIYKHCDLDMHAGEDIPPDSPQ